ncbi:multidrug transporter, partial [Vibrio vulnificus]|nr:multidrug transporter [Vibrio vulnificus]
GIHAMEKKASFNSIQLMYSSYVVLVFYGITSTSISAISDDLVRFASVMFAVLLGIMSLISLLPKQRSAS